MTEMGLVAAYTLQLRWAGSGSARCLLIRAALSECHRQGVPGHRLLSRYETLTPEDLKALPVSSVAEPTSRVRNVRRTLDLSGQNQ